MRLFGKVDSAIDRYDRAGWLTPPFDLAFAVPTPSTGDDEHEDEDDAMLTQITGRQKPVGDHDLSNLSSSTGLTAPNPYSLDEISMVEVTIHGEDVRMRHSGTPTASVGHLLKVGKMYRFSSDLDGMRFIQTTSGGKAFVTYFVPAGE